MANRLPKERVEERGFASKNIIDYSLANYDIAEVEEAYKRVSEELTKMQLALDLINSTESMEIDVIID